VFRESVPFMIRYADMVGRLTTLGLVIVLLVLAGFPIWTTLVTLQINNAVKQSIIIKPLSIRVALDNEESVAHQYYFHPGLAARVRYQAAAAATDKVVQALISDEQNNSGPDQGLLEKVRSEHRQLMLTIDKLFAAINARNTTQADVINRTEVDPLFEQMQQQVDSYSSNHREEVLGLLTLLDQTQHQNFIAMPIVFAICFLIISALWSVLRFYQRRVDDARQAEMARLEEISLVKTRQLEKERQLNQQKDQFIANVSHELRTPLTAVYGYMELLSDFQGSIDTPTQARFIHQVRQGCDDLLALTNKILEVTNVDHDLEQISCEPTSVVVVVQEILTTFDPRVVQEHTLEVDVPEHVTVLADQQALRQVLRNLLSNAFKYAPKGTPVSIRAVVDEHPQVCIRVQDAGPGIPPAELPLLFQKFVRLKRDLSGPVRGTGLGLYISKRLIEAMYGQIWAESSGEPGEGSCFCFTLPRACDPTPLTL